MTYYDRNNADPTYYNRFLKGRYFMLSKDYLKNSEPSGSNILYRFGDYDIVKREVYVIWGNKKALYQLPHVLDNIKMGTWCVTSKALIPQELRHGNILQDNIDGMKYRVIEINDSVLTLLPGDLANTVRIHISNMIPIKLTSKLITKHGCRLNYTNKLDIDGTAYSFYYKGEVLFRLELLHDLDYVVVKYPNGKLITGALEYVHQLQNLKQLLMSSKRKQARTT